MTWVSPSLDRILESVAAIAATLSPSLDLDAHCNDILGMVRHTLQADRVILYHLLPDGDGVVLAEAVDTPWLPIMGQLITDPCLAKRWLEPYRQGRVSTVTDIYASTIDACHITLLERCQVRSNAVVPILTGESRLWGLLIAHQCLGPRQWQLLEIQYLQKVALHIGVALSRSLSYSPDTAPPIQRQSPLSSEIIPTPGFPPPLPIPVSSSIPRQQPESHHLLTFDRLQTPIWIWELDTLRIQWANVAALSLWQADSRETLAQRDFRDLIPTVQPFLRQSLPQLQQGETVSAVWTIPLAGTALTLRCCCSSLPVDAGPLTVLVEATIVNPTPTAPAQSSPTEVNPTEVNPIVPAPRPPSLPPVGVVFPPKNDRPEISGDAVWDWDLTTNQVVMYRRQPSWLGHEDLEIRLTLAEWEQRVHPDDVATVMAAIDHYLRGDRPQFFCEYRLQSREGSYRWISAQGQLVERNEAGKPLRMIGTNTDITDRKRTESALQESRAQLEILFDSLEDFLLVADTAGRILRTNRVVETRLGYTETELKTRTILDLHPPEHRPEAAAIVADMLAGRQTQCTIPLRAKDGTQIPVETKVTLGTWDNRPALFGICRDVSDRIAAEQTLREQEAFLRSIYDRSDVSIFVVDVLPDGHFRYVGLNPANERLTGVTNQAIQGQPPEAIFPPNVAAAVRSHYRSCVMAGETIAYEECLPFRGQDTWWLTKLTPLRDAAGRIYRLIGTSLDISDRVRVESALYESQQKYRTLFETLPAGVSITDAQGHLIEVNPASERILGVHSPEHLRRDLNAVNWQIIRPDGSPMPTEEYAGVRALVENAPVENVEMGVVQPDGSVRWLNVSAAPIPLKQYGVAIAYVDITDRKRMEQYLRDRDEMLRKLSEQVPGVLYQYRLYPDGRSCFPYASEAIREIYAVTPEQVREDGSIVLERLHPDDREQVVDRIWQSFHNLTLWHDEYRVILPAQGVQWREGHAMPEKLADGSVLWHGYIWDITARKQTEAQVQYEFYRERMIHFIDHHIRESLDLGEILQTTVEEVRQFLETDRVIIYPFTTDDWHGIVLAESVAAGWLPILSQEMTDSYFVETQGGRYQDNHINVVNDIYTVGFSEGHIEMLEGLQVRAKLVVPIVHSDQVWGLLIAHQCQGPRIWEASEGRLLQQLAGPLAIAIHQAELHQQVNLLNATLDLQVQERTAQLQQALDFEARLKRITDKVRDSLDERQILQAAVEELAQGLQVEACDTGIYDADHTTSTIAHELNKSLTSAVGRTFSIANAPHPEIYTYLFQGESCQFCDVSPNPLRSELERLTVLASPIFDDQGVLGDLWLFKPHATVFKEQEVRLVQQVANQCAIALRQSRLYQAAQDQVQELERLNRLKDDFLSTVSHELRTPMSNIKMATQMLELMLQKADISDPYDRYLSILKDEIEREIRLINDLLWLTRLDAGTEQLAPTRIDLRYLLPHIAERFHDRAQQQQQHFQLDIPDALPPLTTDLVYLERSLSELLENACKYTPAGETIGLTVQASTTTLTIQIKNSGVEIPIAEHDRIFNTFYRIPSHDPWKYGGTGLGLALVKKLVYHLRGTLTLESQQNWTTFTLHLPWSV